MATRTVGVGAGIGTPDYSSIAAWWAALPATFTEDEILQVRWASSANELLVTNVGYFTGKNMNGFRAIIEPYPGEGFRDHPSLLTNALRYNANNGACIRANATAAKCLGFTSSGSTVRNRWTIRGLQFKLFTSGSYQTAGLDLINCTENLIENNIFEGNVAGSNLIFFDTSAVTDNVQVTTIRNNVFIARGNIQCAAYLRRSGAPDAYDIFDNTAINISGAVGTTIGLMVFNQYHNYRVFNNVALGFNEDFRMPAGSAIKLDGYNATDKASGASGIRTTATSQYSAVAADEFENVTSGSEDLRLKATATKCFNTGTDLYGLFNDIYNQLPAGPRDIGAHENQTGGPPPGWPWLVNRNLSGGFQKLRGVSRY